MRLLAWLPMCFVLAWTVPARADDPPAENLQDLKARVEAEKARAEIERARAEAEKAKAEAAKAMAEAEKARLEAEMMRNALQEHQPPPAEVVEEAPAAGSHTHDGLFLRMTAGPGYGFYDATGHVTAPLGSRVTDPHSRGGQVGGSFSLGGAVGPNFSLHGDLWFTVTSTQKSDGFYQEFGTVVVGGGATYYFTSVNIYITASVGWAFGVLVVDEDEFFDRNEDLLRDVTGGIGTALLVGKEWWVSDNWALGAAVQTDFTYTEGDDISLRQGGVKAVFSATYQ